MKKRVNVTILQSVLFSYMTFKKSFYSPNSTHTTFHSGHPIFHKMAWRVKNKFQKLFYFGLIVVVGWVITLVKVSIAIFYLQHFSIFSPWCISKSQTLSSENNARHSMSTVGQRVRKQSLSMINIICKGNCFYMNLKFNICNFQKNIEYWW